MTQLSITYPNWLDANNSLHVAWSQASKYADKDSPILQKDYE
jgi:hypothetical protein